MSGSLRAQFELTLEDRISGPIEKIEQLLAKLDQGLARIGGNASFDSLWEPVPRCVEQTAALAEATDRAASATSVLSESLDLTAVSADRAEVTMGRAAENTSALGRALGQTAREGEAAVGSLDAITRAAERASSAVGRVSEGEALGGQAQSRRSRRATDSEEEGSHGRFGGLRRAMEGGKRFGEESERGLNHAIGAAAAGYGLVAPVEAEADYQNQATHIGITLGKTGAENYVFASEWMRYNNQLAREYGVRSEDLMESGQFLSQEGYSEAKMRALMPTIGEISTAYNSSPDAVGRTTFALQHNLGIDDASTRMGLAEIARVGKISALPMESLAQLFPAVAAQAGSLGFHGLRDTSDIAAMTAVIRKGVGEDNSATADLRAFMQNFISPHGRKRFKDVLHVDPVHLLVADQAAGKDPFEDVFDRLNKIKGREARINAVGTIFGNEQDRAAASGIVDHLADYYTYRDEIRRTSPEMIGADYKTARANSHLTGLNAFQDSAKQLERHIGTGFVPILETMTRGMNGVNRQFENLEKYHPNVATGVVGGAGSLLAAGVGVGVLGALSSSLKAGVSALKAGAQGAKGFLARGGAAKVAQTGGRVLAGGLMRSAGTAVAAGAVEAGAGAVAEGAVVGGAALLGWPALLAAAGLTAGGVGAYELYKHWGKSHAPEGHDAPKNTPVVKVEISLEAGLKARVTPNASVQTTVLPSGGRTLNRP